MKVSKQKLYKIISEETQATIKENTITSEGFWKGFRDQQKRTAEKARRYTAHQRGTTGKASTAPEIKSAGAEVNKNDVIDLWANLLDVFRDREEQKEIKKLAPLQFRALTKVEESMLYESPTMWKKEIENSIEKGDITIDDLVQGIANFSTSDIIGPWMRETSGHRDLLTQMGLDVDTAGDQDGSDPAVDPEETGDPESPTTGEEPPVTTTSGAEEDTEETSTEKEEDPRWKEKMQKVAVMRKRNYRKAISSIEKVLKNTDTPRKTSVPAGEHIQKAVDYAFKGGPSAIGPGNAATMTARILKTMGITKLSESRLRRIVLEETERLLREYNQ